MLNISLRMSMIGAAIFGAICLTFGIKGFIGLADITDPTQASDAKGFIFFWMFLGTVAIVLGILAWWIERAQKRDASADERPR